LTGPRVRPLAILILLPALLPGAAAGVPMRYIHPAPESAMEVRYGYRWPVLDTAPARRRRITRVNPYLPPGTPLADPSLWYRPGRRP
jgi:hypothetical protein